MRCSCSTVLRWMPSNHRYATLADTLQYCYYVAGVVGIMMAYVMGARDTEALQRATDLGIAFQLTNIARDVQEDAAVDRIYLPADWLAEAGIPVGEIQQPQHARAAGRGSRAFVERSRSLLRICARRLACAWFSFSMGGSCGAGCLSRHRRIGPRARRNGLGRARRGAQATQVAGSCRGHFRCRARVADRSTCAASAAGSQFVDRAAVTAKSLTAVPTGQSFARCTAIHPAASKLTRPATASSPQGSSSSAGPASRQNSAE